MSKSKPITKLPKQKSLHTHSRKANKKPITTQQGDPIIKNLSDFVTSIKIIHSNKPIYTGGRIQALSKNIYATCNGNIVIYGIQNGEVIDIIKYVNQEIANFCVSSDQKYIITFTQNSMIRVQHLQSKKIIHTNKLPSTTFANDIQFSPDNRHVAFALGNSVHIFTFETMKRTHTYNPTNSKFIINKIQWHPNPQQLQIITCDLQRNIAIFDYIVNKVVSVAVEAGTQFCLARNGDILITVNNMDVKVYQTRNLALLSSIQTEQYFQSVYVVDNQLFLGGQQSQLYSLTLPTNISSLSNKLLKKHQNCTDNGISKIMYIGNSLTNTGKLLILSTQQNITIIRLQKNNILNNQGLIVGYNDQIIDIKNNKLLITNNNKGDGKGKDKIVGLTNQNNMQYYVIVTNSNNIKLMNKKTNKMQYLIKGHNNTVLCADYWHPYIASAGKDNVLKLWKINDKTRQIQLLANYNGHSADILSLVALPISKIIATVSQDFTIKLWSMCLQVQQKVQIKSSIRTAIAHQKSINAVRVSQQQDLLATCSQDRTIKIWNQNLTNIMTLVGHKRGVWDAAFHPVQKMIVSAGGEGMLKGWSLESGDCLWSMGQGPALIRCSWLYYNQVVTGSLSGIIKIWDVRKQTSLSYDKHQGKIWALDVTNSSSQQSTKLQIYSGASDSVYHIWQDNTTQMKQNIMHEHQLQQQQRIFYDQHLADKKYAQAAVVAFKAGYVKLFMNALQKIGCEIDPNKAVDFDADGRLMISQQQQINGTSEQQFIQMVQRLKQIDLNRLLINLQAMISTVKHYKISNKLLIQLLKITPFTQLLQLNNSFIIPQQNFNENQANLLQFNQKKSALMKWLENMISYEQKHLTRLNKYIIGTHWIEHKYKLDNPFSK